MNFVGEEVFNCNDGAQLAPFQDLDTIQRKPKVVLVRRKCHCNGNNIRSVGRRFYEPDDILVLNIQKRQIARLLQGAIGSPDTV